METWDIETTAERENVPEWLVEIAQLWTSQSATDPKYREEYQQTRRLARASHVPPFVVILRMFRDTYHVTSETTRAQFQRTMDEQIKADGGQMFMTLAAIPPEEDQRAAYAEELEEKAVKAVEAMKAAVDEDSEQKFKAAAECGTAQLTWLVIAQRMTLEKAYAVMVGYATAGELNKWLEERRPGPPPLIFNQYKKQ
jgi:hypothetical protein